MPGLELTRTDHPATASLLTPGALAFLEELVARFQPARDRLLAQRLERQGRLDAGELPDFLPETAWIRAGDWRVVPPPAELLDRRVEITGPVDRKMVINALNSGASVYMADFEDSTSPTWHNLLDGQANLIDAVAGSIAYTAPDGRHYALNPQTATLMVRPRGWHLPEAHLLWQGRPVSGSLFDFGLYVFHNARALQQRGRTTYVYLPKLENHHEAALWNAVLDHAEEALGLARSSIRCTVLIETLTAAFEMDEILHALREHVVGLNCGRWDYIFSTIRAFAEHPDKVLPERSRLSMEQPFLAAYSRLLVRTCHRRGAFAMGGMAAQIPIKSDPEANERALAKVRADKEREAGNGHDGTWVAHPALVPVAREVFDRMMPGPNQIDRPLGEESITRSDLLALPAGPISEAGVRNNLEVCLHYLAAWLAGTGCVPIHHLMEDAATAEISRVQLWQWARHHASLDDGRIIDAALLTRWLDEERAALAERLPARDLADAAELLTTMLDATSCPRFLTLPAYERLLARENPA